MIHSYTSSHPVALITGASRGLGETLAHFLGATHRLILTARGADSLYAVADELTAKGVEVLALPADVANARHRRHLLEAAETLGRLDLLINNASILGPSPQPHLADYALETLETVLNVNVLAPIGLIQTALPLLRRSRGLVINISSDAALGGYAGWGGYGMSKAALDLASKTLANELSEQGVAVVSVDPGDMRTQMHQDAFPGEDIGDRPLPEVTLPFWAWLLGQDRNAINGGRFQAQAEVWTVISNQ
jgi:NAD(P)-dependent dehydrogenase (short-subunit alcohol dehydrogenase family)